MELDAEAAEAAAQMVERRVRHLPVVRRGSLLGIISALDLLPLTEGVAAAAAGGEPW
jgi:CBS domain-containing protein